MSGVGQSRVRAADSPRWCEKCQAWGDHHTDRHPADVGQSVCPATQEAVIERELEGEMGCPVCGLTAEEHAPEIAPPKPLVGADDEHTPRGLSGVPDLTSRG